MEPSGVGKRVGRNAYFHRDACGELPPDVVDAICDAEALAGATTWNVVKVQDEGSARVSFLTYEDFDEPFPALLESLTVDLQARAVVRRCYRGRLNPPVLHRKELLLPAHDPRRDGFAELTVELERLGLLDRGATIGTREGWARRLREAGVVVVDHKVRPAGAAETPSIPRHLAALRRDGLSTSVQALLRHGLIAPGATVFDYGCGRGGDIEGLRAAGVEVAGWDPYFAPDAPRCESDVVNLGFVLNVIERPLERVEALRDAFALARQCLAVAVITSSNARVETLQPFGDGYVTRLGTFQKYFQPSELKAFIGETLGREALPAGPGLYFVFRDPLAEQAFLLARQVRRTPSPAVLTPRRTLVRQARLEALRPELEALAELACALGRTPAPEEIPEGVLSGLAARRTPLTSALRLAESLGDAERFAEAQAQRRDDLAVYFALNLFNRRVKYRSLLAGLQRDVRAFFGDAAGAEAAGRALLFSVGNPDLVTSAAVTAAGAGLGVLDDEGAYWLSSELIPRLPAVLRCYAGCAERYAGDLEEADVFKFHLASGKFTALRYADFVRSFLPRLEWRTKIDLRAQRIRVYDHRGEDQRLLMKSRLMAPDQPGFARQAAFDVRVAATGLGEMGFRATWADIVAVAQASGRLRHPVGG